MRHIMTVNEHGLTLVNEFIPMNEIEKNEFSAKYDGHAWYLCGRLRTPQVHKIILKTIDDFKLC